VAKRKKKSMPKPVPKRRRPKLALIVCGGLTLAVAVNIAMRPEVHTAPAGTLAGGDDRGTAPAGRELTAAIQQELEAKGYAPGKPTGKLTLETRAALIAYETDIGQPLTGMPSEATLKALLFGTTIVAKGLAPPELTAEGRAVIRAIEDKLAQAGYDPGAADGRLDAALAKAIKRFEAANGLKPTGRIGAELVRQLEAGAS
jgi:peptidoglycan hydrolase-like protein with peptidoglycan-binding domain